MGKKLPHTPKGRIVAALRQVWLRSRERAAAIKRDQGCCRSCGVKQSKAKGREQKIVVHHKNGVNNMIEILELVYRELLCHPDELEVLCPECHDEEHKKEDSNE
jgi:5-methylcytosine-specific restriction endonuclease McrA